jgi:hypothetical protein
LRKLEHETGRHKNKEYMRRRRKDKETVKEKI